MLDFFADFWTFNQNAILTIFYFLYKNIWLILGLISIGYIFFAEQFADAECVKRDRFCRNYNFGGNHVQEKLCAAK